MVLRPGGEETHPTRAVLVEDVVLFIVEKQDGHCKLTYEVDFQASGFRLRTPMGVGRVTSHEVLTKTL